MADGAPNVTALLDRLRDGDPGAGAALLDLVYGELRGLAGAIFDDDRGRGTMQPTALVHEAWMKLDGRLDAVEGRGHFFAVAAMAMRQVLADQARAARRQKRGGDRRRITLLDDAAAAPMAEVDLVELDDCLARLAELNQRHARIVAMRLFGGMTIQEVADHLGVTSRTINTDWRLARAWLLRELFGA